MSNQRFCFTTATAVSLSLGCFAAVKWHRDNLPGGESGCAGVGMGHQVNQVNMHGIWIIYLSIYLFNYFFFKPRTVFSLC